ncbi:MAG: hypothetical protein ACKO2H_08170 [Bacteroidota bacterium]
MSSNNSALTGALKFIGASVLSIAALSIAMFLVGKLSPGSDPLGSHRWMTGMMLTVLGMIIGISSTYAPNPLDNPGTSSAIFTNMFEWCGIMAFFGGIALFLSAQAAQFNF